MAHTAHKSDEAMEEIEMTSAQIDVQAHETAKLITKAKKVIFFTGAGISTSAGVPDFRGPQGAWTLAANGEKRTARTVSMSAALATSTHMSLVELQRRGKMDFLISQNVDGLHRRTGIPPANIAELHGNSTIEECQKCGHEISRDFQIHGQGHHFTGRKCSASGCDGDYRDVIIGFGEDLPAAELANGFSHSEQADLHICLGSSLTVRPACDMPRATKDKGGKLVVVNLQRTPLDAAADVRVFGRTDFFMERVMYHLGMQIPDFVVHHRFVCWPSQDGTSLHVTGVLDDGTPQSSMEAVTFAGVVAPYEKGINPMTIRGPKVKEAITKGGELKIKFFAHYDEPEVVVSTTSLTAAVGGGGMQHFECRFNPSTGDMRVSVQVSAEDVPVPNYTKGKKPRRLAAGLDHKRVDDGTGIDYSGWFAVTPLKHCTHCSDVVFKEGVTLDTQAPCLTCGNVGENMQCLSCFEVHCGRHVNQHMIGHHDTTQHPMVVGFADLSFWCYPCEAYIEPANKHVNLIYKLLHNSKFGFEGPSSRVGPAEEEVEPGSTNQEALLVEEDEVEETTAVTAGGFNGAPLAECAHCKNINKDDAIPTKVNPLTSPCLTCGHVGDNMLCLECFQVHCGRHQRGHMVDHHDSTEHRMVMGFKDLCCWCYSCDNYVSEKNKDVQPHYAELMKRKDTLSKL